MKPFRTIEHTADIGIEVEGSSLTGLFVNAAEGMMSLVVECRGAAVLQPHGSEVFEKISLKASIREELLVKWLEELLYLFEMKSLVPVSFKMNDLTDKSLEAEVVLVPFSSDIHSSKYQIKAVTYHNLTIKEESGLFKTTIIFDI